MAIEKRWVKVVTLIFLGMMVVGFSVPSFFNSNDNISSGIIAEPRLCSTDADCYLLCDGLPTEVICSQNLCQQNTCEENANYKYNPDPLSFSLQIGNISLNERSNPQDLFIKFLGDNIKSPSLVELHSSGLSLKSVLEKVDLYLNNQCLTVGEERFCKDVKLLVNGEQSFLLENYVPQEGDEIEVVYS